MLYRIADAHRRKINPYMKKPLFGYYSVLRYDDPDDLYQLEVPIAENSSIEELRNVVASWAKAKGFSVLADNGTAFLLYSGKGNCFIGLPASRRW